jgi:hypothetical protein
VEKINNFKEVEFDQFRTRAAKPINLYISIYQLDINLYKMVRTTQILEKEKFVHSPTLNTVFMVEETLKKSGELLKLAELKRKLPKQVMHQTLIQILDYLQLSGKIVIGTKGILWVFTERKELNELISRGTEEMQLLK